MNFNDVFSSSTEKMPPPALSGFHTSSRNVEFGIPP